MLRFARNSARLGRLLAAGAVAFLALQCQSEKSNSEGMLFRYNEASGISSLDPAFARDQAHNWVIRQLYTTLFETDSTGQLRGLLAEAWGTVPDGLHAGIRIRRDFAVHDDPCFEGHTHHLDAHDVASSLQRLKIPVTASPGAWLLETLDSVWAAAPDSLVFALTAPDPALWSKLSVPYTAVVPRQAIARYSAELSEHPVGSGPFQFKAWQRGQKLVLRRHPNYAERDVEGQQLPYLEAVSITFTPDRQSAFMAFVQGELDFLTGIDPATRTSGSTPTAALRPSGVTN